MLAASGRRARPGLPWRSPCCAHVFHPMPHAPPQRALTHFLQGLRRPAGPRQRVRAVPALARAAVVAAALLLCAGRAAAQASPDSAPLLALKELNPISTQLFSWQNVTDPCAGGRRPAVRRTSCLSLDTHLRAACRQRQRALPPARLCPGCIAAGMLAACPPHVCLQPSAAPSPGNERGAPPPPPRSPPWQVVGTASCATPRRASWS